MFVCRCVCVFVFVMTDITTEILKSKNPEETKQTKNIKKTVQIIYQHRQISNYFLGANSFSFN